jgi:hypothetical protein
MPVVQSTGKLFNDSVSGARTFTNAFPANVTAGNTCFVTLVHFSFSSGNRITGVTVGGTAATLDVSALAPDLTNIVEIWRDSAYSLRGGTFFELRKSVVEDSAPRGRSDVQLQRVAICKRNNGPQVTLFNPSADVPMRRAVVVVIRDER